MRVHSLAGHATPRCSVQHINPNAHHCQKTKKWHQSSSPLRMKRGWGPSTLRCRSRMHCGPPTPWPQLGLDAHRLPIQVAKDKQSAQGAQTRQIKKDAMKRAEVNEDKGDDRDWGMGKDRDKGYASC